MRSRWLTLALVLGGACRSQSEDPRVRVAAASDLAMAFDQLSASFGAGRAVFSFGSSGQLAKQLAQGAPFDVFFSASPSFVDEAVNCGACDDSTRLPFARGQLVAWVRDPALLPKALSELSADRFRRVAIANPEHAPYGRAASEALESTGVLEAVRPKLVFGENVRQALQLAESGNAEVALVARSLVGARPGGAWLSMEPSLHAPIEQELVLCGRGDARARGQRFAEHVTSPEGQQVLERLGFIVTVGGEVPR